MKCDIDDIILRFVIFANPSKYLLQRLVYFCKMLEINIDVHYRTGIHGIYSEQINTIVDDLTMDEAIKEDNKIYKVGNNFNDYFDINTLCVREYTINHLLSLISSKFCGKEDYLNVICFIHFVFNQYKNLYDSYIEQEIIDKVKKWFFAKNYEDVQLQQMLTLVKNLDTICSTNKTLQEKILYIEQNF